MLYRIYAFWIFIQVNPYESLLQGTLQVVEIYRINEVLDYWYRKAWITRCFCVCKRCLSHRGNNMAAKIFWKNLSVILESSSTCRKYSVVRQCILRFISCKSCQTHFKRPGYEVVINRYFYSIEHNRNIINMLLLTKIRMDLRNSCNFLPNSLCENLKHYPAGSWDLFDSWILCVTVYCKLKVVSKGIGIQTCWSIKRKKRVNETSCKIIIWNMNVIYITLVIFQFVSLLDGKQSVRFWFWFFDFLFFIFLLSYRLNKKFCWRLAIWKMFSVSSPKFSE